MGGRNNNLTDMSHLPSRNVSLFASWIFRQQKLTKTSKSLIKQNKL